jgi:dipeptidyl aminopeptidase/acylaminoacyl peptidase
MHFRLRLLTLVLLAVSNTPVRGQPVVLTKEAYLTPPKEILDAVLATENDNFTLTNISPDGTKFLITKNDGMPTLTRMARPCVYLGEMAFDHTAHRSRQLWVRSNTGFDIFYHADKRTVHVQVPENARVSNPVWSPDGSQLAYFAHFDDATYIYVAETAKGVSRRVTDTPVLATMVTTFQWSKDGQQIETVLVPEGSRELPKPGSVATEPRVRVARDGAHPSRTYRYLLESPYDAKLLEHLATGQLALVNVNDGKLTKVGAPDMIRSVSMAPGEQQFRVATIKKPFSYFVPVTRFGFAEGIWNREGKSQYTLADRGIQQDEPAPTQAPQVATAGTGRGAGRNRGAGGAAPPPPTGQQPPAVPGQPVTTDPQPPIDPDTPPRFNAAPPDPEGRRDIAWRPDGQGLSYIQPEPADPKDANKPRKDRVMQWLPPFEKDKAKVLYETANRIQTLQYSDDCKLIFLTQTVENQRQISAIDLQDPSKVYVIHKSDARFGTPQAPPAGAPATPPAARGGSEDDLDEQQRGPGFGFGAIAASGLLTKAMRGGSNVVRISATGDVYVTATDRQRGEGAPAFPKPYLDKINIKTGKKQRIYEGKGDLLETIDAVDGDDVKLVFTTRQKTDVVPDSFVTDLASGKTTKLTNNVNRFPWFQQLKVERFQVTRVDGFKFWVKVTTPPKREGKLPALFWIYPREYVDQAAYNAASGRTAATSQRFAAPQPRSMTLLTLAGYAVVEPDVPIVGPAGRMNDNYVPDLRNSLWAVIDELDKKGIIDRDRLAVGGHSYGAFSTANALAHTPFFKAGIAGDGNYNRTLTMMTFQTERRQFWDARDTYLEMSPVLWANRVNGALLMYHGMDDANVGTNPINAEFMFMVLDGLGKPAALYMYPYEGHGPIAKETTLDLWARWVAWLDTYVKNPKKK